MVRDWFEINMYKQDGTKVATIMPRMLATHEKMDELVKGYNKVNGVKMRGLYVAYDHVETEK